MPSSKLVSQRNVAAALFLSSASLVYINNLTKQSTKSTTSSTNNSNAPPVVVPSFALGGCERSGGGV